MKDITVHSTIIKYVNPDTFNISFNLQEENKSFDETKNKLSIKVNELNSFLDKIDVNKLNQLKEYSFSSKYNIDKSKYYLSSYILTYNVFIESKSIEKLKDLFELIISSGNVNKISFSNSKYEEFEKEMFKEALDKNLNQKNLECSMVGEDGSNYKISSWKNDFKKEPIETGLIETKTTGFSSGAGLMLNFKPKPIKLMLSLTTTYSK